MNPLALMVAGLVVILPGVVGAFVLQWLRSSKPDAVGAVRSWLFFDRALRFKDPEALTKVQARKADLVRQVERIKHSLGPSSTAIVRLDDEAANHALVEELKRAMRLQAEHAVFDYFRKALADPTARSLDDATAEIAEVGGIVREITVERED